MAGLILQVLVYILAAVGDPMTLVQGVLWKFIFLSGLIYAMIGIVKSDRIRRESEVLEQKKYI